MLLMSRCQDRRFILWTFAYSLLSFIPKEVLFFVVHNAALVAAGMLVGSLPASLGGDMEQGSRSGSAGKEEQAIAVVYTAMLMPSPALHMVRSDRAKSFPAYFIAFWISKSFLFEETPHRESSCGDLEGKHVPVDNPLVDWVDQLEGTISFFSISVVWQLLGSLVYLVVEATPRGEKT